MDMEDIKDIEIEEETKRGRKSGQVKDVGYIVIDDDIRIKIEEDNLTIQERTSAPTEDNDGFNRNHYYSSWEGILKWLIRHYATEKISKKKEWLFTDARKEFMKATDEVIDLLVGNIQNAEQDAKNKLKRFFKKL